MATTSDICDAIGRKNLATALGVGTTAVSNAAVSHQFPASWYKVVKMLSDNASIECPDELFAWRSAEEPAEAAE